MLSVIGGGPVVLHFVGSFTGRVKVKIKVKLCLCCCEDLQGYRGVTLLIFSFSTS